MLLVRLTLVQLSALALRLVPRPLNAWPDWVLFCVTAFSGAGASTTSILEFLMIVVEEVGSANLVPGTVCVTLFASLKPCQRLSQWPNEQQSTTCYTNGIIGNHHLHNNSRSKREGYRSSS